MKNEMEQLYIYFDSRTGQKLKVDDTKVKLSAVTRDYRDKSIRLGFEYKTRGLIITIENKDDYFIISTAYGNITDIHPKFTVSKDYLSDKIVNQVSIFIQDSDRELKEPMDIKIDAFDWRE